MPSSKTPRRTSWRILPGSSSVAGSVRVPCWAARVRRVPRARSVPRGRSMRAAHRLSRPKSVKNHGTPAARNVSPGDAAMAIRSDWRSSRLCATRAGRASVVGGDLRTLPGGPGVGGRDDRGRVKTSTARFRSTFSPGLTVRVQVNAECSTSTTAPGALTVTATPLSPQRNTPSPDGSSPVGPRGDRGARPAFACSSVTRSPATSTRTARCTGVDAVERTVSRSVSRPGTTMRCRSTRTVGSGTASPSAWARPTKRLRPGPSVAFMTATTGSQPSSLSVALSLSATAAPSTAPASGRSVTRSRLTARTSAWKSPCTAAPGAAASRLPSGPDRTTVGAARVTERSCRSGCRSGEVMEAPSGALVSRGRFVRAVRYCADS